MAGGGVRFTTPSPSLTVHGTPPLSPAQIKMLPYSPQRHLHSPSCYCRCDPTLLYSTPPPTYFRISPHSTYLHFPMLYLTPHSPLLPPLFPNPHLGHHRNAPTDLHIPPPTLLFQRSFYPNCFLQYIFSYPSSDIPSAEFINPYRSPERFFPSLYAKYHVDAPSPVTTDPSHVCPKIRYSFFCTALHYYMGVNQTTRTLHFFGTSFVHVPHPRSLVSTVVLIP